MSLAPPAVLVPLGAPDQHAPAPVVASGPKQNRRQREAAALVVEDAPCQPVLLRAAITGRARMPRAGLEITRPDGSVLGHVTLMSTSAAFDPTLRWWLVGDPQPGDHVALVSAGRTHLLLPGGRLRAGPVREPEWSPLACRMLGWQAESEGSAPDRWHAVFAHGRLAPNNPAFLAAVARFRQAAVVLPLVFFLVCFPYLFAIRPLVDAGVRGPALLVLPVAGGGAMALWSAICRQRLGQEAERIEPGAARWTKEIAFTQSYWSGMRKPPAPWTGPLPRAAS
jgi:hypothetical protein